MSLTQGALLTICQNGTVENPNLLILSSKRIAGSSSERYRLLISDGMYSNSYAMLATQLNGMVAENQLDDYCVVKVKRLQCNTMQGKKVIIILEMEILRPGSQVGQKIGSPVAINADGTVNENDQKVARQAGKRTGDEQAQGQPVAKKPLQQMDNKPSMLQNPSDMYGSRNKTASSTPAAPLGTVYPIVSLTPYQNKWTIKARVTNKSDIRRWSNARGEGHLFSMDLVDESGEIRATAFKEQCDKYYDMIEIGKVFYITQGTLKAANKQYSSLNNDYELTFRDSTEVVPCTDEDEMSKIPTVQFDFCKISQLDASLKDTTVDIIGVVKSAGDVVSLTSSRTQKELKKRELVLVDKSLTEVSLTLWGTTAENFSAENNPILAIKGAKVSDYSGVSLGATFSSVLQINPDLPQSHELRGWYDSEGSTATTSSLTQARTAGGGDVGANIKTFGEVKKDNLGMNSEKGDYYSACGYLTLLMKDKALYMACGNQNDGRSCNKKVQDQNDGTYRCEKCNISAPTFNWRLILSMNMADCTDNNWVSCFQEQGEALLGINSEELGAMFLNDRPAYDKVFTKATFQRFTMRLRAKVDNYNDEQRIKHTMFSAVPLNYKDYNKKMIQDLEEAGIPIPSGVQKEKYL